MYYSTSDHEPIQGKQYTDAEFQRINNSLVRRIGTLNCGHAASPIIMGVCSRVFSMQRPQRWPSNINGLAKIEEVYYDIDNMIGSDYFARAYRGEMSLLDANNLGQRAVVEEMCKQYKIPFRFESWDELSKR